MSADLQMEHKFTKAFLVGLRLRAVSRRARLGKDPRDPFTSGSIEERTRERAFMREVRGLGMACGPLPACSPAAAMVRLGDLTCSLSNPPDVAAAAALFRKTGICVFDGALPKALADSCHESFKLTAKRIDLQLEALGLGSNGVYCGHEVTFNEVCQRGRERLDIRGVGFDDLPMRDPRLHSDNAAWMPFVRAVLGEGAHECFRGFVDNRPGSDAQEWHADGVHESYAGGALAPMAVADWHALSCSRGAIAEEPAQRLTCFLPLTDLADPGCGATQFFPGSHCHEHANLYRRLHPQDHESQPLFCTPQPDRGGLICFDYRLVHRGSPCLLPVGGATRPILYIVYAREGYDDEQNFPTDRPLFEELRPIVSHVGY